MPDEGEVDGQQVEEYKVKFAEAVGNDINTSMGLTVLYDALKADTNGATKRAVIMAIDEVLSLQLARAWEETEAAGADDELTAYVEKMIQERAAAKKDKNFARADEIRDELREKGVQIKDTREGVQWEVVR